MSIIVDKTDKGTTRYTKDSAKVRSADLKDKKVKPSTYAPTDLEKKCRSEFLDDFRLGWQTMHLPRPEFNDLSLYQRHITDMLAFNTYQENDGNPMLEDRLGGWRSTAMRPIQRNKAVSIAAHMTARQLVPKIFAYNKGDEEQEDARRLWGTWWTGLVSRRSIRSWRSIEQLLRSTVLFHGGTRSTQRCTGTRETEAMKMALLSSRE